MAFPANFDEANDVLNATTGVAPGDKVLPLNILRTETVNGTPCTVSCWKLTQHELDEINRTGRVWLTIIGRKCPPVGVYGSKPFQGEPT